MDVYLNNYVYVHRFCNCVVYVSTYVVPENLHVNSCFYGIHTHVHMGTFYNITYIGQQGIEMSTFKHNNWFFSSHQISMCANE